MSKRMLNVSVVAVLAAGAAALSTPASATPLADALAINNTSGTQVEPVWYYREWGGYGPPFAEDAIDDGAPYYYGRRYDYPYDGPYYGYVRPYYRPPVYRRDIEEYCASRFRSWDPETGTFLGYDGLRHPCP